MNILEIPKKAVNNNIYEIKNYDYDTFKKIATGTEFVEHFKNKVWNTTSSIKLKTDSSRISKGAIKFDFNKDFDFYNFYNLEAKIEERTKLFESINWKITNQTHYQSSKELNLWEIWLEQIKYIDLVFVENGL
jgi:hypothetical protein